MEDLKKLLETPAIQSLLNSTEKSPHLKLTQVPARPGLQIIPAELIFENQIFSKQDQDPKSVRFAGDLLQFRFPRAKQVY